MPMIRYRLAVVVALSALALLVLPGCGSGGSTSGAAKPSLASPSSVGRTYASKAFALPLTVTVDASLKSPTPNPDSRNLLSWDAAASSGNKVRFLVPVNMYRPGSSAPEAPAKDYLTYLQALTRHGVKLTDVSKVTIDGHPATLMSATSATGPGLLDGSLGCPKIGADQSEGCFGIQPDLILRIAVIPVGNSTLLASWVPQLHSEIVDASSV